MHEHTHGPKGIRALGIALGVTLVFFVVEFIGGMMTNSLALQTDALHMLNDAFALVFALAAAWFSQKPITNRRTYGHYRAEVLAAFLNGILLWGVVVFVCYEALQRMFTVPEVKSLDMLIIAVVGLVANVVSAVALSGSREDSLNVKGAFLHVVTDMLGSVGAILAGAVMLFTGWYQADPLVSLFISALVFYGAGRLVKESLNVLLEGVPANIDLDELRNRLATFEGVKDIHDLHVWCITPTKMCIMSAHVIIEKGTDGKSLMTNLISMLKADFGIDHTTIQLEDEQYPKASNEH